MKVITYQSSNGNKLDLTRRQIKMLEAAKVWPKDSKGAEYCTVSRGLHEGYPTFSHFQMLAICRYLGGVFPDRAVSNK